MTANRKQIFRYLAIILQISGKARAYLLLFSGISQTDMRKISCMYHSCNFSHISGKSQDNLRHISDIKAYIYLRSSYFLSPQKYNRVLVVMSFLDTIYLCETKLVHSEWGSLKIIHLKLSKPNHNFNSIQVGFTQYSLRTQTTPLLRTTLQQIL